MELKEAIEQLKYDLKIGYGENSLVNRECLNTVLEELNNRILIKKIKKVLEKLDERAIYPDKYNYYARLTVSEALFLKHFIENEILNKE